MKLHIPNRILLYFILMLVGVGGFFFTLFVSKPIGFYAFILLAAVAGLGVATNIWDSKRNHRQLVCPSGSDCDAVVTSRYSKFFGISLEYWGMGYFVAIIILYLGLIFFSHLFSPLAIWGVVLFSLLAGLFSAYLLFVQGVLLKKWCIWCLLAAMMSLTICVLSLVSLDVATGFLAAGTTFLSFLQLLGYTFGVGGATASVFLFAHFLKDDHIDEKELSSLKGVFEMVWVGLGFVLISQYALFIVFPELAASPSFVIQIITLFVAAIASAVLMIILAPFLVYVPFGKDVPKEDTSFASLRTPIAICGSVVIASWYAAFSSNFLVGLSFGTLLVLFVMVLASVSLIGVTLITPRNS